MERTARIISLDVWGNQEDGWDVNASYRTDWTFAFEDLATEPTASRADEASTTANILGQLCSIGFLNGDPSGYDLEWQTETDISISHKKSGRPILDLAIED